MTWEEGRWLGGSVDSTRDSPLNLPARRVMVGVPVMLAFEEGEEGDVHPGWGELATCGAHIFVFVFVVAVAWLVAF